MKDYEIAFAADHHTNKDATFDKIIASVTSQLATPTIGGSIKYTSKELDELAQNKPDDSFAFDDRTKVCLATQYEANPKDVYSPTVAAADVDSTEAACCAAGIAQDDAQLIQGACKDEVSFVWETTTEICKEINAYPHPTSGNTYVHEEEASRSLCCDEYQYSNMPHLLGSCEVAPGEGEARHPEHVRDEGEAPYHEHVSDEDEAPYDEHVRDEGEAPYHEHVRDEDEAPHHEHVRENEEYEYGPIFEDDPGFRRNLQIETVPVTETVTTTTTTSTHTNSTSG